MYGRARRPDGQRRIVRRPASFLTAFCPACAASCTDAPGRGPQSPYTADGDGKATAARSPHGQLMGGSSMRKTPGSASGATNVAYTVAGWSVRLRASCGSSPDSTKTEPFGEPAP
jgi:hypothetical protein